MRKCVEFRLYPHALEYLKYLKSRGKTVGIATACQSHIIGRFMDAHLEVKQLIDWISTCDEYGVSKPTPVVYQKCAENLKQSINNCVIFEDSYAGILGAS